MFSHDIQMIRMLTSVSNHLLIMIILKLHSLITVGLVSNQWCMLLYYNYYIITITIKLYNYYNGILLSVCIYILIYDFIFYLITAHLQRTVWRCSQDIARGRLLDCDWKDKYSSYVKRLQRNISLLRFWALIELTKLSLLIDCLVL